MHLITDSDEIAIAYLLLKEAGSQAKQSKCKKSQRGVVIVKNNKVIAAGYNKPTIEELCCLRDAITDNSRAELCTAVHAEQMALLKSIENPAGGTMYHIKLKNGCMVQSGRPSCTVCSRMILEADVNVVLWQKECYVMYSPEEFNKLCFEYFLNGLQCTPGSQ